MGFGLLNVGRVNFICERKFKRKKEGREGERERKGEEGWQKERKRKRERGERKIIEVS